MRMLLADYVSRSSEEIAFFRYLTRLMPDLECYENTYIKPTLSPNIYRFVSKSAAPKADNFVVSAYSITSPAGWRTALESQRQDVQEIYVLPTFKLHDQCYVSCVPEEYVIGHIYRRKGGKRELLFDADFEPIMKSVGFSVSFIESIRRFIQTAQAEPGASVPLPTWVDTPEGRTISGTINTQTRTGQDCVGGTRTKA